jgi:hypothetical protein
VLADDRGVLNLLSAKRACLHSRSLGQGARQARGNELAGFRARGGQDPDTRGQIFDADLKTAFADLTQLGTIWTGQAALPTAKDFRTFVRRLWGVGAF